MNFEFWDIVTNFPFVVAFSLVVAFFVPVLISIKKTWEAEDRSE